MTRQYRNDGRDQIPIENVHGNVYIQEGSRPTRSRSEFLLLQAVKQEVISRLAQSLHNAVFINLGMQSQPQQVKRPWDAEIKIGSQSPEPLSAETSILEVFDRAGVDGRLLILGEPGAGKTTTMLDLAEKLCDRAEQDATAFIPVLLNLSSWKDPKQAMTDWLVEELRLKYGVRKDIGKQWLAEKQLLPLLDGLDEVKPERQESCVQAINHWLESEDRPPSLAVCCRREEYEKVVRGQWQAEPTEPRDKTRMYLNGAILLQTLTEAQIEAYLSAANQPELWQMLQQDEELRELIRTPLWLSITLLSYEGLSLAHWLRAISTEQRLTLLLNAYVERTLHKESNRQTFTKSEPPTAEQTQQWLAFMAQQLQQQSQTELLIEQMQPFWLQSNNQKRNYRLIVRLGGGLILLGLSFRLFGESIGVLGFGLFSVLSALNAGLDDIDPIEVVQISLTHEARRENYQRLSFGLHFALVFGLFGGICGGLSLGLFGGMFGGLSLGLFGGLIPWLKISKVDNKISPNQGIRKSALNFLLATLFFGTFFGLAGGLSGGMNGGLSGGIIVGLSGGMGCGLIFGGLACLQHFALRFVLYRSGSIPWNYARFLDYCTERLLLQRVGGGYRFMHKSLQEHFAKMGE